jgi:hypothetical protein
VAQHNTTSHVLQLQQSCILDDGEDQIVGQLHKLACMRQLVHEQRKAVGLHEEHLELVLAGIVDAKQHSLFGALQTHQWTAMWRQLESHLHWCRWRRRIQQRDDAVLIDLLDIHSVSLPIRVSPIQTHSALLIRDCRSYLFELQSHKA